MSGSEDPTNETNARAFFQFSTRGGRRMFVRRSFETIQNSCDVSIIRERTSMVSMSGTNWWIMASLVLISFKIREGSLSTTLEPNDKHLN